MLQELGHIPQAGESVELTAFDPDGDVDDPVRWLATVVAMDGRRIDLLELYRTRQEGGLMGTDFLGVLLTAVLLAANAFFVGVGIRAHLCTP